MENITVKALHEQWKIMAGWISGNLKSLTDDEIKVSLAPGKNHGVWILGHLIQSEDELSIFLGRGPYLYPENEQLFSQGSKLQDVGSYPPVEILRKQWENVKSKNDSLLSGIRDEELNEPHCGSLPDSFEGEDFFRTKGRCIMIWNLHQMYHNGQLAVLLSMAGKASA